MIRATLILMSLAVAGCSSLSGQSSYLLEPAAVDTISPTIGIPDRRVSLLTISLPLYAESQEIPVLQSDGSIAVSPDVLWADEPERALTGLLAETLSARTGAVVAAEPWPLESYPDSQLEVRVSTLIARADGGLRFSGVYFVTPKERPRREIAERFAIDVPAQSDSIAAIAAAQVQAVTLLADQIAQRMAR